LRKAFRAVSIAQLAAAHGECYYPWRKHGYFLQALSSTRNQALPPTRKTRIPTRAAF